MKKFLLSIIALTVFVTLQAQWVNNPVSNTFLANTSDDAGEIYTATDPISGDTYLQWSSFVGGNGWAPTLQRLNFEGVPQWGNDGIHPNYHTCASWSQGVAMAATTDNAVVTCFATEAGHTVAIKINADGTYAWGEQGITLFGGHGESRTELLAGDDGGVWALGTSTDEGKIYVCYIEADGTINPTITISDPEGKLCMFGLLVPTEDGVFVVYEKETWAYTYFYEKDIWVAGYNKSGEAITTPTRLMAPQTIGGSYCHYVVPDGLGGGYAYIFHPAIGGAFNTYVFHFNANGESTITDPNGVAVHSSDPENFYLDASAAVDPVTHDLIIVYEQTDAAYQTLCRIWMNRINSTGDKLWGDGELVYDSGTIPCGGIHVDAFQYGDGFSVIYHKGVSQTSMQSTVEAKGFDMNHNQIWATTMCSNPYNKTGDQNTTGFHDGQNITVWVNSESGGLYGQNIGQHGEMGTVTPPTPPTPCYPPTDLEGEYYYLEGVFGANISWTAPVELPLYYNLYRQELSTGETATIVVEAENDKYFDEVPTGDYIYRLTAVHEDCESDYARTATGDDYVLVTVDGISEIGYEEIVTVKAVYSLAGQRVDGTDIQALSQGMYIIKGVTESGKVVIRKIVR